MKLSKGRMPPSDGVDRYHLPVAEGVTVHANSLDNLKKAVFEYRLRNNIPPGDIERDINAYYCAKWPTFCHEEPHDLNPALPRVTEEPMLNRVSRWASTLVHSMPKGGYPLVEPAEASRRGEICAACQRNGGWRGRCGGCSATTLALLQQLKQLRKTERDGSLMGCTVAGWENSTAAWLPKEQLALELDQQASLPDHCWRKTL